MIAFGRWVLLCCVLLVRADPRAAMQAGHLWNLSFGPSNVGAK